MLTWSDQDAKAKFSEFLDACLTKGAQMVTRRGVESALLITVEEWRCLQAAARPSLKELLLSDTTRTEDLAPVHGTSSPD
jgi:antitoxin Phd